MEPIKVVSYQRVSTQKQETDRQHKELIEFCDYKKYELVREFIEKESGLKDDRKELKSMLDFIKETPEIEFVIVNEFSRLGRTKDVLNTRDFLHSKKVGLISLKENLYSLNPDKTINSTTQMVLEILASVNSAEVDTIKYRMKSGRINKTSQGYWMGNPKYPYGYMIQEKRLVINPVESEVIHQMVEMYLNGKGTHQIAKYLNQKGIQTRTNKKWYPAVVYQILTNENLIGKRVYLGVEYDCPAILDKKTFNKVQETAGSKKNKQGINQKHEYLLDKQKIVCGVCGRSYYPNIRRGKTDSAYMCTSNIYPFVRCGNRGININKLESTITDYILKYYSEIIVENIKEQDFTNEIKSLTKTLKENSEFLKKEENKESILLDNLLNGNIKNEVYQQRIDIIKKEKIQLEGIISTTQKKLDEIKELERKSTNLHELSKQIQSDKTNARKYIRSIVDSVTLIPEPNKVMSNYKNDVCFKVVVEIGRTKNVLYLSHRSKSYEPVFPDYSKLKVAFE